MMDLVAKYLSGNASLDEQKQVEEWRDDNPEEFLALSESWSFSGLSHFDTVAAKSSVLNRIETQQKFGSQGSGGPGRSYWGWAVAASVVLLLGIGYFVFFGSEPGNGNLITPDGWVLVETGKNETREVTLPDGSLVALSELSSLSYPQVFDTERNVGMSGRAFFDIKPDEKHPFKVETYEALVTVLGTSFQIRALDEGQFSEVIVATGKVSLAKKPQANVAEKGVKIDLVPGEIGIVKRESKGVSKAKNGNQNYLAWKTNKMVFNKTSLREVASTLHDVYKIDVQFSSNAIANCRLTATFEKKSVDEVMEVISQTFGFTVAEHDGNYLITGIACN